MRKTSDCEGALSFNDPLLCCVCCTNSGEVYQVPGDMSLKTAYDQAVHKKATLILVWPGRYRTDAFVVDNLDDFAQAKGLVEVKLPVRIIKYEENTQYSTRFTKCINVYYELTDGESKLSPYNLEFYIQMKKLLNRMYGWEFASSKGYGQHDNCLTVYVKR